MKRMGDLDERPFSGGTGGSRQLWTNAQIPFLDGNRAVVRNGHLPEREILTGVGPVAVEVPKVRDRSGNSTKYNSTLVPTYVRRSAWVAAALPWRYL